MNKTSISVVAFYIASFIPCGVPLRAALLTFCSIFYLARSPQSGEQNTSTVLETLR